MKPRMLFAGNLDELKGSLDNMQFQWDIKFIENRQDLLATLANETFDVIVTDMSLDGINNAEFFSSLCDDHPKMIRMMILDDTPEATLQQSAIPAHQFLAKPCDPDVLEEKVTQAFSLRRILMNEKLMTCISQMKSLPSPPTIYFDVMKELGSGKDKVMTRVGELIATDIGMTAKIQQIVNSAHFGLMVRVSSPVQAARLLGPTTIKALVLSCEVFTKFDKINLIGTTFEQLSSHSQIVGSFAKRIVEEEKGDKIMAENAFLAGILHDTGKLILAQNFPEQYQQVGDLALKKEIPVWQAEQEIFGASHAEMGAYLAGLWGMSDVVVEALAFHHRPGESFEPWFNLVTAIHVANVLEHELYGETEFKPSAIDEDNLTQLGLIDKLPVWRESCHATVAEEAA